MEVTEAGRWVSYVFLNPATGDEGIKHSWVVRHDGLIIGSGWYEKETISIRQEMKGLLSARPGAA